LFTGGQESRRITGDQEARRPREVHSEVQRS
jgi:hypothetical protein